MLSKKLIHIALLLAATSAVQCTSLGDGSSSSMTTSESNISLVGDSKVAVVQSDKASVHEMNESDIRSMVRDAVEKTGGLKDIVHDGDAVIVKPNLVVINDYTLPGWQGVPIPPEVNGVATDWRVTKAVVELVREINPHGKVYVMEGSAVSTVEAFKHYHYTHENIPGVDEFIAIEEASGGWQQEDSPNLVRVRSDRHILQPEYFMNRLYKDAKVLISLPTLKNHWKAVVSGAIKNVSIGATPANIYGRGPGDWSRSTIDHDSLAMHQWIHDFFVSRPVQYVVMDGLQGIQNGPTPCFDVGGTDKLEKDQMNMRLILASQDSVAIDTVESLIVGWDPYSVEYLKLLEQSQMGRLDTTRIQVVGAKVDQVKKKFAGVSTQFSHGGAVVTDETPPSMQFRLLTASNGTLRISLNGFDGDLRRVEVRVGPYTLPAVVNGFDEMKFDTSQIPFGFYDLQIDGYDLYRNRTTVTMPKQDLSK